LECQRRYLWLAVSTQLLPSASLCPAPSAASTAPRLTQTPRPAGLRYNLRVHRLLLLSVMGAVAVLPPSLQAQRGRAAGGAVRTTPRMGAPARVPVTRGVGAGGVRFVPPGNFGHPGFVNPRFRHHHHVFITSGCFGYPYRCTGFYYPYSTPYYSPYWAGPEYTQQPYAEVQQTYDDTALRNQIDRLTYEVERLRQEQEARQAPPPPRLAEQTPTVLVFRDGHRSEVQNYGIVGQTLWVFTERRARKYPLSDLDLPATKTANEQRGVEFVVPEPPTPRQSEPMSPGMLSPNSDEPAVLKTAKQATIRE